MKINTIIVPLLFLSVVVILAGCTNQADDTLSQSETKEVLNAENADQCKYCRQVPLYGTICKYEEDCLYDFANTIEDCKSYKQLPYRYKGAGSTIPFDESNVEECIRKLASRFNDTKFCDELEAKDDCYFGIALNLNDPTICNGLTKRFECLKDFAIRKELKKVCGEEVGNELLVRESCIIEKLNVNFSTFEDSFEVCKNLFTEDFGYKDVNEDECTVIKAINIKDLSLCDNAGEQRANCYGIFANKYDFVTLADCDRLGVDWQGCYYRLAIRTSDTSICEQLSSYAKDECLKNIALDTNDISLCSQLQESGEQKYCANGIYNEIRDNLTVEICDAGSFISNLGWVDECYFTIAKETLDISLCEKSGRYKDECKIIFQKISG